ncbi:MAG: hypothetical protein JNM89_13230 [Hyphomicrobiaceae bacterium]|nr:hypothetical protein [Hyphomicrobiaceae bacterium]
MSGEGAPAPVAGRVGRAVAVGAFVTLAGPVIGALLIAALSMFRGGFGWSGGSLSQIAADVASVVYMFVLFGYVFGVPPALAAAIWLGWRTYRKGGFGYIEAAVTGGLAPVVYAPFAPGAMFGLAPIGLFAALIGRYLLARAGWISAEKAVR